MIFIKNKYYNWYYGIIQNAKSQPRVKSKTQYYEKHHIIPRSLDGDDTNDNLVFLTAREHFICHYLLCKMLPEKSHSWYSMIMAFNMMKSSSWCNIQRYFNSRLYDYARKNMSTTMSNTQSGDKNSQFGTCWVIQPLTNTRTKISKLLLEEYIGQGWYGPKAVKYRPLLSWENKNTKSHKPPIIDKTLCKFCGTKKPNCLCGINRSTQILKGLNKYFNLSLDNLGTPEFINDWNTCKNYAQSLYNQYSTPQLCELLKNPNPAGPFFLLQYLGIKTRTVKEAQDKYFNKVVDSA
jgi:hypothetical protein